jgi:hypothetical protein
LGSKKNRISENGRARRIKMAQRVHFPTRASCAYANASERSGSMSIADLVRDGISSVGKDGEVRGDSGAAEEGGNGGLKGFWYGLAGRPDRQ